MKRKSDLIERRRKYVEDYILQNHERSIEQLIFELSERLFLSERTIYGILTAK